MSDLRMNLNILLGLRDHAIEPSSNLDRTREQYSFFRVLTSAKPLQLRDIRRSI